MSIQFNQILQGDCVVTMQQLPAESADLVFADPPFNIDYPYDEYKDHLAIGSYLGWTTCWGAAVRRVLKPTGTLWLAIGDEWAAEIKLIFQNDLGFTCRDWVVWYYTFGVNCKTKLSRSHTHLLHFVRDPKSFTFNQSAILVPSARQTLYNDKRAAAKGRIPDNTWILRPEDGTFAAGEDTWHEPRVCGTHAERQGWHPCQMPERIMERIILLSSNPGDVVLDPFSGSGTTCAVAKRLGRRWLGIELSGLYAAKSRERIAGVK